MANDRLNLDEAFTCLQQYFDRMERQQPGYMQSREKLILERDFMDYMRKSGGKDIDEWLRDKSLRAGKNFANRKINKTGFERFWREVKLGGRNLLLAPFRLAYQLMRLVGAITSRLLLSAIPNGIIAMGRSLLSPAYAPGLTNGRRSYMDVQPDMPYFRQPQQKDQQQNQAVSKTVVQPDGQLKTTLQAQNSISPQPATPGKPGPEQQKLQPTNNKNSSQGQIKLTNKGKPAVRKARTANGISRKR
ncbi:hypothetical protein ACQKLP_10880 [Chitinophaga sp. NPDC101104]|uniref:hypothetical protein n=1 Tax=Chitinophaga sp. NPDC101104 TaxID=3390561 RepID=UPI003CFBDA9F